MPANPTNHRRIAAREPVMPIKLTGCVGVILAGGLSRRMAGPEKTLLELENIPLIKHAYLRLADQLDHIIINANGSPERFEFLDLPVIADLFAGYAGPLAGIHAAMYWARTYRPEATHIVSIAADTPFFPADLVEKLKAGVDSNTITLAASGGHRHPVFGLWPVALADDLSQFLSSADTGKVLAFVNRHRWREVEFNMIENRGIIIDPFFNINTPEDLATAGELISKGKIET
jgi:molybdenum cofactor guanylyltransferase